MNYLNFALCDEFSFAIIKVHIIINTYLHFLSLIYIISSCESTITSKFLIKNIC